MLFRRSFLVYLLLFFGCTVCCTSIPLSMKDGIEYPPSSILALNQKDLYKPAIVEMKSKKQSEAFDHLVLCHFSDIHGSKDNLIRIIEFCDFYDSFIDDILHTGDSVTDQFSDDFSFWDNAGASSILNTIGNHDTAILSDKWEWYAHIGKDSYDKYFAPYISFWDIEQPKLAKENGLCYYYKDYKYSGIRLIVLDCMKYDLSQHTWFVKVLSEAADAKYAIICVSHFAAGILDHSSENVFDSRMPVEYTSSYLNEDAAYAVDAFIDNGGEFVCWLGGHIHIDSFARLMYHPRQICINVAEAKCSGEYGDQRRVLGAKSQDLFNLIAINRNCHELSLLRVGADRDILGRYRFKLTVNY